MDTFKYKGRNKRGEMMQGTIESANSQAVAAWMISSGISPINIQVIVNKFEGKSPWLREFLGGGAIGPKDLILFTRQIGTMIKSGVPIMQAIAGMQKTTINPALVELLKDIRVNLDKGVELSAALALHPKIFDDYYVSMVRVGESSGQLEEIFKRLFEQLEFERHMKMKIKGAMRYPSFVLIAVSIAIAVLTIFVIPVFANMYSKLNATLPVLTRILLGSSRFAVDYWWAVLAIIGFTSYAFKLYTDQPTGRYNWDKFKLRIPIMGRIQNKATLARFCRSFATATKSGVPLMQAFTLVSRVVDNAFFEERILLMRSGVERGESLLRAAQTASIFSPQELQMISVGEQTGDMESMLNEVADMYQEEVDFEVGRLSESIEPILLGFMGVLVLVLMLGIFLPMWQMGQVMMHPKH
ncbi:MAG: type II secretion system F family protein [Methylophilales bacterium]|nr:type II secretion system F family protein [Methylophilales bacterium]